MHVDRLKLFVSYSHADRQWLEMLQLHLAVLQRRGAIHVWSDTRLGLGERWRDEIEVALTESRVALLMLSPNFLASEFIWDFEMERIVAHQSQGMEVWPIVVRPCAWRLVPELAELQVRPLDGRPLSFGESAETDHAFTAIVYEVAARLNHLPSSEASEAIDGTTRPAFPSVIRDMSTGDPFAGKRQLPAGAIRPGQTWSGRYDPTGRWLSLQVLKRQGVALKGRMVYEDDGSVTSVAGELIEGTGVETPVLRKLAIGEFDAALTLREVSLDKSGKRPPQLNGHYLAFVRGKQMFGVWMPDAEPLGELSLALSNDPP